MGSFNNTGISGLWIGGKSVRRASLGGKVFFEKHDYDFSLTSDKSILSHADNESATLTATLTDYNEPVSGETVIFTADTPFKTNVINDTGTYDFGDYISVDISNFKNIDAMSTLSQGALVIGNSNAYLRLWGLTGSNVPHNFIWLEHYVNGSRIDNALIVVNHPLIFRNGILYCYRSVDNSHDNLQDSTLDVSDVDLNEWAFSGKVIGVDVTVDEYWWASDVTDSNGEATVGYVSKGAGDLNIKVECMNLQETYTVHDYYEHYLTTFESQVSVNLSLPSNYIIQFILTSNSGGDPNICYLRFDSSSGAYVGKGASTSRNIVVSGINQTVGQIGISVDTEYTFTKQNGVVTCTDGTNTVSGDSSNYNSLNHVKGSRNGKVKDIRIIKL